MLLPPGDLNGLLCRSVGGRVEESAAIALVGEIFLAVQYLAQGTGRRSPKPVG